MLFFDPLPEQGPDAGTDSDTPPDLGLDVGPDPLPVPPPDPDLVRLQNTYGDRYRIWCTEHWWMATARIRGVVPTEMERTPWELEERLRNPGKPIGQVNL